MKKMLALSFLAFGLAFNSHATDKNTLVTKRANNLSNKMIRSLKLNNYQSSKIKEINTEVAAKMLEIEEAYAGNQELIDQKCKEICSVRDRQLERVLSTAQYNAYYGSRKVFNKEDKEFMSSIDMEEMGNQSGSVASLDKAESANKISNN